MSEDGYREEYVELATGKIHLLRGGAGRALVVLHHLRAAISDGRGDYRFSNDCFPPGTKLSPVPRACVRALSE